MIAGIIEANETPEEVARRESVEEAGCELLDVLPISSYLTSPGGSSERMYLFCARVDSTIMGGVHGLDIEHEDILLHIMPSDAAYTAVVSGQINNATTILALQWLQLNKVMLQKKWQ